MICLCCRVLTIEQGALQWCPAIALSEQGYSNLSGQDQVKKLVHISMKGIMLSTWNIDILTDKMIELVNVVYTKKIEITCHQETK